MPREPREVVNFWIGADRSPAAFETRQKTWYVTDPATDREIETRFGETLAEAEAGKLASWVESSEGALALVILFDQFTRNLRRGTADAYRNDEAAQTIVRKLMDEARLETYDVPSQILLCHPLLHSEDSQDQAMAVKLYEEMLASAGPGWHDIVKQHLDFTRNHADIVSRFGRFPHRNQTLGRKNTAEEERYLQKDKRRYGQ